MPSAWTLLWFGWGLYFLIVEGMALANSTSGDTLSEHVWAWLGLRNTTEREVTWRTWIRRGAVLFFMALLAVHFVIGSNTVGNTLLAAAGIALGALVLIGWLRHRIGGRHGDGT